VLHCLGDTAGFCAPESTPIFEGVLILPDRPCWGQPEHKP